MNAILFQSLVEKTSDAVFIVSVHASGKEFVMRYVNDAYLVKFNVTRESVIDKEFRNMLSPDILDPIRERFIHCAIQQEKVLFEETFSNGTTSLSEIFPILGTDGNTEYIVGTSKNITELKRNRDQLAESENTLQSIINSSDNVLIYLGLDLRVIYANKRAQEHAMRLFGEPFRIGEYVYTLYPPEAKKEVEEDISILKEKKRVLMVEKEVAYPDGERFWFLRRYYAVYDADEQMTGVVIASVNITDQKLHQEEIKKHTSRMREIATIQSHEIRRPLANVIGLVDLIDMRAKSLEENEQILNYLKVSARELDKLITRIVDTTHIE